MSLAHSVRLRIVLWLLLGGLAVSPPIFADDILDTMDKELKRAMKSLAKQDSPPYFISYEIRELDQVSTTASFGALQQSSQFKTRVLTVDLRVGSHALDNSRPLRSDVPAPPFSLVSTVPLPLDTNIKALQKILWRETNKHFGEAKAMLTRVKANEGVSVARADSSHDFSQEKAQQYQGEVVSLEANKNLWEDKLRLFTDVFNRDPLILESRGAFQGSVETRWLVNSEGTKIRDSQPNYQLFINAQTRAQDGMELPGYRSYLARDIGDLPDDKQVIQDLEQLVNELAALREAPVVDPFTGPAILTGRASGVFFHEVFGHRIEGHRQKNEEEGQTFRNKVGQTILPENFSVHFDPGLKQVSGNPVAGHYLYDNQGVPGKRVDVVKNGLLQAFLMSRAPIDGFPQSNGHGRSQVGFKPVARQSNMVVEVDQPLTSEQLKTELIKLIREQNQEYGLIFSDIQGGLTLTGRLIPNSFNVIPIMVHRLYPDGREELVRGVDLIGTPLTAFSKVLAADNQLQIFNGFCGAESGQVPVAAVSPSILLSEVEVQRKEIQQLALPILPRPTNNNDRR